MRATCERLHLNWTRRVLPVLRREPNGRLCRGRRPALCKRPPDRLCKRRAVELEPAGEVVKVEEVLDATVPCAQNDEGLELLRDDGFWGISQGLGRRKVEQPRVDRASWRRPYRIADSHVDLQPEARRVASRRQDHARAGRFVLGANRVETNGVLSVPEKMAGR